MNQLFQCADRYLKVCTWKDMALLKFCLAAMGVLIGLQIPRRRKKEASIAAGAIFVLTYVPLMIGFLRVCLRREK